MLAVRMRRAVAIRCACCEDHTTFAAYASSPSLVLVRGRDLTGSCDGARRTGARLGESPPAPSRGSAPSKHLCLPCGARRPRAVTRRTFLDINNGRGQFQCSTGPHPKSDHPSNTPHENPTNHFLTLLCLELGRIATRPPRGLRDRTPAPPPPAYAVAPSVGSEATTIVTRTFS